MYCRLIFTFFQNFPRFNGFSSFKLQDVTQKCEEFEKIPRMLIHKAEKCPLSYFLRTETYNLEN